MAASGIASRHLLTRRTSLFPLPPSSAFLSLPRSLQSLSLESTPPLRRPALAMLSSARPTTAGIDDDAFSGLAEPSIDHPDRGFKRPEVVEWQKELANSVNLIGSVGRDVEIKYLDTGKVTATAALKVLKYSPTQTTKEEMWFFLEFWNELAEIAAAHLKKGDRIFVSGLVNVINYLGKDGLQKTLCKVIVRDLKYVKTDHHLFQEASHVGSQTSKISIEDQWKTYFNNPSEWWDNRSDKRNPRAPDFKHKTTGDGLWIDSKYIPPWVVGQIQQLDRKGGSSETDVSGQVSTKAAEGPEKLWQAYFASPSEWWDNREAKKNPRYPDFKHKTTGEALWISGQSCPPWVKSQLAALGSKVQAARGEGDKVNWWNSRQIDNSRSSFQEEDLGLF